MATGYSRTFGGEEVHAILQELFESYTQKRLEELLSTTKGAGRLTTEQIQSTLGKAQAAHELRVLVDNRFGF